jgi:hypothetical protein
MNIEQLFPGTAKQKENSSDLSSVGITTSFRIRKYNFKKIKKKKSSSSPTGGTCINLKKNKIMQMSD